MYPIVKANYPLQRGTEVIAKIAENLCHEMNHFQGDTAFRVHKNTQ